MAVRRKTRRGSAYTSSSKRSNVRKNAKKKPSNFSYPQRGKVKVRSYKVSRHPRKATVSTYSVRAHNRRKPK